MDPKEAPDNKGRTSLIFRAVLGSIAVLTLRATGFLPVRMGLAFGAIGLPLYIPFRRKTRERLGKLSPPVPSLAYYRMRLRLFLLSLKHVLGKPDGCTVLVEGAGLFADALATGKPVALFGWHQGPVELLHRIPAEDASFTGRRATGDGRKIFVLTAGAFSPALEDWMARGRAAPGVAVVRPGDVGALRAWARGNGVLALMTDQVPGVPEDWLSLRNGAVSVPWPRRLADWIAGRDPECLAVSVHWEAPNRIVFRYDRVEPGDVKEAIARRMEAAIARAPGQYNWSYPKAVAQRRDAATAR